MSFTNQASAQSAQTAQNTNVIVEALSVSLAANKKLTVELDQLKTEHALLEKQSQKIMKKSAKIVAMSMQSLREASENSINVQLANGLFVDLVKKFPNHTVSISRDVVSIVLGFTLNPENNFGVAVREVVEKVEKVAKPDSTQTTQTSTTNTQKRTFMLGVTFGGRNVKIPEQGYNTCHGKSVPSFEELCDGITTLSKVLPDFFTKEKVDELSQHCDHDAFFKHFIESLVGTDREIKEVNLGGMRGFSVDMNK